MRTINNRLIIFAILISISNEISSALDFELIFSLREYFQSDVILLAKKENDEMAKKLYKYKNSSQKVFTGIINIERMSTEIILQLHLPRFQNMMLISEFGKDLLQKLIDFHNEFQTIIVSSVLVIFIKEDVKDMVEDLYLPFNSRFFLVQEKKNASKFDITDVYQIGVNGSKIYSNFCTWDKEGKSNFPEESFYFRRLDLKGHVINVQTPSDPQYATLWVMYSEKMNFTIRHKKVVYGGIYPNGTKTGIFQMLDDRTIDGTQHDYKYSHQRANHFDYIIPVYIAETLIYMDVEGKLNWTLFIAPFRIGVWIALLIWIILSSITVYFTYNQFKEEYIHHNFGISIFAVIQALCNQGNRIGGSNISFYIAHAMPYLLSIIIVNSYSGVFLSHLTVKHISPPFNNLLEFVKDGSYKILVEEGSYPLFYFQTEDTEEAVLVREKALLVPKDEIIPFEAKKAGFQKLCRRKIIYITGTSDYSIEEKCNIMNLKEIVLYDVEGIIVWRGFPYRDVMNKLLKRIQFAGLIKLQRKNTIIPYENKNNKALSLESVLPLFMVYICSIFFSIVIFLWELAMKKYNFLEED